MMGARTLADALDRAADSTDGYIFVVDGVEARRPYAAVRESAFAVARSLSEAGLRRGDVVALIIPDAEGFLTALFGASIGGFTPASLCPPSPSGALPDYFDATVGVLRSSRARAVITSAALVGGFEQLRRQCPDLQLVLAREALNAAPIAPDRRPEPQDIAFVQFTSGSTSTPKGVALSHQNLSTNVEAINGKTALSVGPGDIAVSWLPLYHDMGLVGMALCPLYAAQPAVLLTPIAFVKRPAVWLRAIAQYHGTISFAPNFAYDLAVRRVKERDLEGLDLSSWRIAGCGAEPIHAPTLRSFAERFGPVGFSDRAFLTCYGLAEHVLAATFPAPDRGLVTECLSADELTEHRRAVDAAPGEPAVTLVSCGGPFPGHEVRVIGEDGRPVAEREVGEITLRGPSVMLGYYKDGRLTSEAIRDGWLHTGDLGYLSNGELFVCGRAKEIIIVHGRKYHPQDLEWAVSDLAGLKRGRVVAFGTIERGATDRVVMVIEPSGTVAPEVVREAVRRRISDVFGLFVDDVVAVPSGTIGRTTSGKVQRAAARARYERGELVAAEELGAEG